MELTPKNLPELIIYNLEVPENTGAEVLTQSRDDLPTAFEI